MRVHDLLEMTGLGLTPLTGRAGLDRRIRWVCTSDLPDPGRYLCGGDLLLTGLMWRRDPADSARFAAAVADGRVACVAAGNAAYGCVPPDLVAACRELGLPLLEVPADVSFAAITERVVRALRAERDGDAAGQLSRQRRLLDAVAEGAGLDTLLRLAASDAVLPSWLLTATGRAPARAPSALSGPRSRRLAEAFLSATQLPHVVRVRYGGMTTYSLFQVGPRSEPRAAGWFLAFEGDHRRWPRTLHDCATELAALVGLERERVLAARRASQLAVEAFALLAVDARPEPTELAARANAADLDDGHHLVVTAALSGVEDGGLVCAVLTEALAFLPRRARLAVLKHEAVAFVPAPADGRQAASLAGEIRGHAAFLEPGLGSHRLSLGVSLLADGWSGLRTALHEARQARLLAERQPERVAVLSTSDIDSHTLLLATVPRDVRDTFRARVLGSIIEYDARRHTDLMLTLRVFLDCSGSWAQCAEVLHLHVNTLRYRIQRIEDLTGRSLASMEDRVDLFVALRAN